MNKLKSLGRVTGASGVTNFFGDGWWYHLYLRFIGLLFWGMTFTAKTTTLLPRKGNMPLGPDGITPTERFPKCVHITPKMWWHGIVLNAVGLSGPGAQKLFDRGLWQEMRGPIILSFMSVAGTKEERLAELREFVRILRHERIHFKAKEIVLQINYSCPNTGHKLVELAGEVAEGLDCIWQAGAGVLAMLKFNVGMPVEKAFAISNHPACAGICISNTIPFGTILPQEWWEKHFGTDDASKSPLAEFGGGGLSGKPLLPLVEQWVRDARKAGVKCHINAGGGILGPIGAARLFIAGADSVFLGSIAMLRPWMVLPTIWLGKLAGWLFARGE